EPASIGPVWRRALGDKSGLLLSFDQLEELVTLSDPAEGALVAQLLAALAEPLPGIRLLATARADFLTRLASMPYLGEALTRALFILGPLSEAEIRTVITGPAHMTGLRFESEELVDSLVEATAHAEGGLPLLQFALAELWEARDRERALIPAAALESLGGVGGALARHADSVLAALLPAQRKAARKLLMGLVTVQGTRRRRAEA